MSVNRLRLSLRLARSIAGHQPIVIVTVCEERRQGMTKCGGWREYYRRALTIEGCGFAQDTGVFGIANISSMPEKQPSDSFPDFKLEMLGGRFKRGLAWSFLAVFGRKISSSREGLFTTFARIGGDFAIS